MYAPSDFNASRAPARPPVQRARMVGLAVLLVFVFLCLVISLSLDAQVFIPHNTQRAITATHRARTTQTPQPHRPTPTLRRIDQPVYRPQLPGDAKDVTP